MIESTPMNVPNILTMSRLGLAAVLMALLSIDLPYFKTLALVVFVIAGITDYLDGYLARNVYGVTSFGKLMDPLTDKVIVCAAFVSFVELQLVPAWIVVIIIAREFLVTGLRLMAISKGEVIAAGKWGKHKTVWQIVGIVLILMGLAVQYDILAGGDPKLIQDFNFVFKYVSLGIAGAVSLITVASGARYVLEHKSLFRRNF
jgi:CDP-diacylglycerol--glycerol-3-phosphate 3-phosphatidyltransferase